MTIVFLPPSSSGAASVADATDTTAGKIRISTTAESNTGTNDTTAMTPLKVQQRISAALAGGVEYKGAYTGQSLVTAQKGDLYVSSGSQTLAGVALANNDHIIFSEDAADPVTTSMFDVIDNTESDTLDTVTSRGATTSNSVQVGGLNIAGNYALPTADGSAGQILKTDGSGSLTFQSLGSISSQAANNVNISGGSITGITDLAIADGGTGASDAATALSNLGGIGSVLADTAPVLGGDLDVSTYDIKTTSGNALIGLEAHGTGFTELRGNTTGGNNPGAIRFNCEQNSHGVILKSPLHNDYDNQNDYTLTLPTGLPASDKVLQSTSAGVLSWVAQSAGGSRPVVTEQNSTATLSTPNANTLEEIYTVDDTSTVTITLASSSATGEGFKYNIKRLGTGSVVVQCATNEFIDHVGQSSYTIQAQYDSITLVSNSTSPASWVIV